MCDSFCGLRGAERGVCDSFCGLRGVCVTVSVDWGCVCVCGGGVTTSVD